MPIRVKSKYSPRKTIRGKTSAFVPNRTLHSLHAQYRILIVNLPRLDPRISLRRLRNSVRTAVVLSGGEGIRLLPITKDLPKGLVKVDHHDNCLGFLEKPILKERFISTGVYVFDRRITRYLPRRGDIERVTFPSLSRFHKLGVYRHPGSFITVNSLRELEEAENQLKGNHLN